MTPWIMLAVAATLVLVVVGAAVIVMAAWAIASDAYWTWRHR